MVDEPEAKRRPARRGVSLAEAAKGRDNNFDVIRLFAAGLVLFSHSFPLTGRAEPLAPHTLGTVGVEIFFATSGFLVAGSWTADPAAMRFFARRALRILPGLIVAVLVTAFVLGPIFTRVSLAHYLGSSAPWTYTFDNVRLRTVDSLGSVFAGNPLQFVNGSLWTLPVEVYAYGLLVQAALCGALRSRRGLLAALVFVVYWNLVFPPDNAIELLSIFFGGVVLYAWRDRILLRADIAALLLLLWLAAFSRPYSPAVGVFALPYLVAFLAYRSPRALRRITSPGDVSYGMYVYAFPIGQAFVAVLGAVNPLILFAATAPVVWLVALGSWHFVEAPALARKPRRPRESGLEPSRDARVVLRPALLDLTPGSVRGTG